MVYFYVTASDPAMITTLYQRLKQKYRIKRLGPPTQYLNWNMQRSPDGSIHISQGHTISSILEKLCMSDCNTKQTPLPEKLNDSADNDTEPLPARLSDKFRRTIGDLRYIADSTRPDIYHALNRLAFSMVKPHAAH